MCATRSIRRSANIAAPTGTGGGVWWDNDGIAGEAFANVPLTISNSIFWGNTAAQAIGSQLRVEGPTTIDYSDFQGGPFEVDFDAGVAQLTWGAENLQEWPDPLFVSPLIGDYRLDASVSSPCIDTGSNALTADLLDAEQHPRIKGCIVDMGALEYASIPIEAPVAEPDGLEKNRFISFSVGNEAALDAASPIQDKIAIRVRLNDLMNPQPPDIPAYPAPDFSVFENQGRWVGPPQVAPDFVWPGTAFTSAALACAPNYPVSGSWQWSPTEVLHVTGETIVPSSTYTVQVFEDEGCPDVREGMFSAPLTITTARWGDVTPPYQDKSATGNASQPNVLDITVVVDAVEQVVNPIPRYVASLRRNTWPFVANVTDITLTVDAVKANAYPYVGPSGGPVFCPCDANIRTDSNNDGVIDGYDELVEDVSPGVNVYLNDDDDNDNGTLDMDETAVQGEDDLVEVQLPADCFPVDPEIATWSVSWTNPSVPSFQVWTAPDKSAPVGPLGNGVAYAWPPPAKIWLEAIAEAADVDITFTISDDGSELPGAVAAQQSGTIKATAKKPKTVRLRVVMMVEPAMPDPDNPPNPTGCCKLGETKVREIVRQLLPFARRAHKDLRFIWGYVISEEIERLEANCCTWRGIPFASDISICTNFLVPGDDIRRADAHWYFEHVVNGVAGGVPGLQQDDSYDTDECTVNIYFVGNVLDIAGVTGITNTGKLAVLITDGARRDHTVSAINMAFRQLDLINAKTLPHEVLCHLLTHQQGYPFSGTPPYSGGNHTPVTPGTCNYELCVSGNYFRNALHSVSGKRYAQQCFGAGAFVPVGLSPPDPNEGFYYPQPPVRGSAVSGTVTGAIAPNVQNCNYIE